MTRTTLPVAAAVAVAAGLLLTACGGGGSDSSDKIQSSTTQSAPSAPPTTATTQPAGPSAPKFDLPSGLTVDFKGFDGTDAKQKAVLLDTTYAATAVLEAESKVRTAETPNLKRFFTGVRGAEMADQVISYGKSGNVATGAYHFYQPKVTDNTAPGTEGTVKVAYCEDERKAYDKDAVTGEVHVTKPSLSDFRAWTFQMKKGTSGDWQVYDFRWDEGAKQCQVA